MDRKNGIISRSALPRVGLGALALSAAVLCFVATAKAAPRPAGPSGAVVNELYATAADGTPLHWDVYTPSTPGPWPAVLVIHGGGFVSGGTNFPPSLVGCAQDLASAGYLAFSIEYRLAPPGSLRSQRSNGQFPDQTDDVRLAVQAARADARTNGKVGAVGGSAGGSHAAFVATTGTIGNDRLDVAVSLSGAYDLSDFSPNDNLDSYTENVTNYVGVPTTDTTALRAASPAWLADATASPVLMVNTIEDPMPYIQLPLMFMHLDALGVVNYQALTLTGAEHSFDNWPGSKTQALTFLANAFAGVPPPPPLPPPSPGAVSQKLLNISTRANVGLNEDVLVGGFIVAGTTNKRVVLRAIGPSLTSFGVNGALANPMISLYDSSGILVESNDDRQALPGIPNPLLPANPKESLLSAILPPGAYTAILQGVNGTTGVGLVEVYDADPGSSSGANISTRGNIPTSAELIIGGFIIGGTTPTQVIVRGLGPSLTSLGITNALPDPVLELHDENGNLVFKNDNWRSSSQAQQIIATGIPPTNDLEAAIVETLAPGAYTILLYDSQLRTGVALVEAYNLTP